MKTSQGRLQKAPGFLEDIHFVEMSCIFEMQMHPNSLSLCGIAIVTKPDSHPPNIHEEFPVAPWFSL